MCYPIAFMPAPTYTVVDMVGDTARGLVQLVECEYCGTWDRVSSFKEKHCDSCGASLKLLEQSTE
jgi:hypothetical protein